MNLQSLSSFLLKRTLIPEEKIIYVYALFTILHERHAVQDPSTNDTHYDDNASIIL